MNIPLLRDDVNNHSYADLEKLCKKLRRSVKDIGFNISCKPGLKRMSFLYKTVDLTEDI